ncbi:hypothetical protein [Aequorivita marina]|uniref:hypothetical protein n=1 Tax=Aequorivita marina TaxID=3073654 RepID=UPI00287697D5|nr:hypothetical protein [Aequorivita sp. S2608]MDS1299121.1 hypothetical protein [Aequorivita sp. S2608]
MSEIKINKRKTFWPWILVILIFLAAIFFFRNYNNNNSQTEKDLFETDSISQKTESKTMANGVKGAPLYSGSYGTIQKEQTISDYLNFVESDIDAKTNDDYYRSAFFKLITATKRISEIKNLSVTDDIAAAMKSAEKLTNVPPANQKANHIKMASEKISNALRDIQQENYPNYLKEMNAVATASDNISPRGTIADDKENIDTYFDVTAVLLQKMFHHEEENQ